MKLFYTKEEVIDGIQKNIEALDFEKQKIDEAIFSMDQLKLPLLEINFQEDYTILKNQFDISDFIFKITQKYNQIKKQNEAAIGRLDSIVSGDASEETKESASQKLSSVKEHQDNIESIFKTLISLLGDDSLGVETKREKAEEAVSSFGVDVSSISSSSEGLEILIQYIKKIIKDVEYYLENGYISIPASSISTGYTTFNVSKQLGFQLYALAGLYSFSKDDFLYLKEIKESLEESQYFINKIAFTLKKEKIEEAQKMGVYSIRDKMWEPSDSLTSYNEEDFLSQNIIQDINKEIGSAQNKVFFEIKSSVGKYIKDIFEKAEACISNISLEKIDGDGLLYQIKIKDYISLFESEFESYCEVGNNFFSQNILKELSKDLKRMTKSFKSRLSYPTIDALTTISFLSAFISEIPTSFYSEFCFSKSKILKYLDLSSTDIYMKMSSDFDSKAVEFFKEEKGVGELESLFSYKNQDGFDLYGSSKQISKKISLFVSDIIAHMSSEGIQNIEDVNLKDIGYTEKIRGLLLDVEKELELLNIIKTRLIRVRGSFFKSNGVTSNFNILKEVKLPYFSESRIDSVTQKIEESNADYALIQVFSGDTFDAHNRGLLYNNENVSEYSEKSKCFIKILKNGKMEYVGFENLIKETFDLFIKETKEEIEKIDSKKEILQEITSNVESPHVFWDRARKESKDFSDYGYQQRRPVGELVEKIKKTFEEKNIEGSRYNLDNSLFFSNFKSNESISQKMISELSISKIFGLDPVEEHKIKRISFSKYKQDFSAYSAELKGQTKMVSPKFESMIISKILTNLNFGYPVKANILKNGDENPIESINIEPIYFEKESVSVDNIKNSYSIFYDIFEKHSSSYSFSEELKQFLRSAKKKQNSTRYTELFLMLYESEKPLSLISFIEMLITLTNISAEKAVSFAKKILKDSDFSDAILYEALYIISLNGKSTNLIDLKSCLDRVNIELGEFEKSFVISNVLKNAHNSHSGSNICEILYNIFSLDFLDGVHKSEAKSGMLDFASELTCLSFGSESAFSRESFNKNLEKLNNIGFEFDEDIIDDLSLVSEALVFSQNIFGNSKDDSISLKENFYKIKAAMNNIKFLKSISNLRREYLNIFSENKDVKKKEELFDLDFEVIPGKLRFRVLKKYDSYAMKVGADTNCCQVLGGAGEPCVIDSLINPTASVLILEAKFEGEETLRSLSGKNLPEQTVDGYRIISQSYFHFVEKETDVEVEGIDFIYNKYFVLDNIEASFSSMKDFKKLFSISFDEAYKRLSSHAIGLGYSPIIVGKSFSPEIIKQNTSGSSSSDNRTFTHTKKYTDFSSKDFVVLDKSLDAKMARYFGINRIYKNI